MYDMKKFLIAAATLASLPASAQAQSATPGFYVGVEGGLSWLLNTTVTAPTAAGDGALNSLQVNRY